MALVFETTYIVLNLEGNISEITATKWQPFIAPYTHENYQVTNISHAQGVHAN